MIDELKLGLLATVVAGAIVLGGCGAKSEAETVADVRALLAKQQASAALVASKSALQSNPESAQLRFLFGSALLESGDPASALLELQKARDLGYEESELIPRLARAMVTSGKFNDAIAAYGGTHLREPAAQAELRTVLSVAYARSGKWDAAVDSVDEALKLAPKYGRAMLTKARLLGAKGEFDAAMRLIDAAMAPGEPNGEAHYLRGFLLQHGRKDLDAAAKSYQEAQKDPRQSVLARGSLIALYLQQRKLPELEAVHAEMVKSQPEAIPTQLAEGQIAFAKGDLSRAREALDKVLKRVPNDPRVLLLSAGIDVRRGALVSAESQLGKALQQTDSMPILRRLLAETYIRLGQPEKAHGVLRPLLESGTGDADAFGLAGEASLQVGNPLRAVEFFSEALKRRPSDTNFRTASALAALAKGQPDAAFESLQAIAAADPGETADKALIAAHLNRNEIPQALAAVTTLEKKSAGRPIGPHLRGVVLRKDGNLRGARAAFEMALKADPAYFPSITGIAEVDIVENRLADARRRYEEVVKLNPRHIGARLAIVSLMEKSADKPEAIDAALEAAIKADATDPLPRLYLVGRRISAGNPKGALDVAQAAIALAPDNHDVLDALGRAQSAAGDDEQASNTFRKLATQYPRSVVPHIRLADIYVRRKDTVSATVSLRRAFEIQPEAVEVHRRMLALAQYTKSPLTVIAAARELQKLRPTSVSGWFLEGDAEAGRGNWPAAIAAFRGALGKVDLGQRPPIRLFNAYEAAGQREVGAQFAAEWMRTHPKDARLREHLGQIAMVRGEHAKAEALFEQVVAIEPHSVSALNNLAWVQAELGKPAAVQSAQRAVELAPGRAPVLDTLAKALASQGQVARAIEIQRQAIAAAPDPAAYQLQLARLYVKAGENAKALAELEPLAAKGSQFPGHRDVAALKAQLSAK